MLDPKTLNQIQSYFSTQKGVVAVYLYGSQATGKSARKRPDIDLAVLFDQPPTSYSRQFRIQTDLQKLTSKPIEVREISRTSSPVFLMAILSQGKAVYVKNQTRKQNFEVFVMREYEDTQALRDIQYRYFQKQIREANYAS